MSYLPKSKWPQGAKQCPTCDTGYYVEPWKRCYLCHQKKQKLDPWWVADKPWDQAAYDAGYPEDMSEADLLGHFPGDS